MTESNASPTTETANPANHSAAIPAGVQSAARWFWWIAGLSLVNTVMTLSGNHGGFVMGLGITAFIDGLFAEQKVIGLAISAAVIGLFVVFGLQGVRGKLWAFLVGITLYALDALVYVLVEDWMPVAFHGLALFFLVTGAIALIAHRKARA
ncbi:hypothetical protein [Massilia glaciei]|uniref:DUF2127 domain-containing protein n=1 Tax=Massilia glaciei TaxID=1524097 RepID=A0A2U2HFC8_9BURK|nr:hypothetical protein [Massilia glaciei]PWF42894.1 hypothetical protein C7C56_022005 [Massilia glaciei]